MKRWLIVAKVKETPESAWSAPREFIAYAPRRMQGFELFRRFAFDQGWDIIVHTLDKEKKL